MLSLKKVRSNISISARIFLIRLLLGDGLRFVDKVMNDYLKSQKESTDFGLGTNLAENNTTPVKKSKSIPNLFLINERCRWYI